MNLYEILARQLAHELNERYPNLTIAVSGTKRRWWQVAGGSGRSQVGHESVGHIPLMG